VLASLEDGVVVVNGGGRVTDMNPAAEQLLGVSAAAAVGMAIEELFRMSPWLGEAVRGTLGAGVARRRNEGPLFCHGHEIPVRAACAPLFDDALGAVRGAVIVLNDLSMQRTLEAATRRADRLTALGAVAQGLAHEIRNPLGGIKGAAQLLRGQLADPDMIRCTDVIVREVERLDGLVEQLRELGTPPRLQLVPLNIHRVLNDVLALQKQAPVWGDTSLHTGFDPSLPPVRGDRAQLTQVFLNLVKNGLEANGGHGELHVSTRLDARFHLRARRRLHVPRRGSDARRTAKGNRMNKRILVIEDTEDNRQILRDLLTAAGYDIFEATDGATGVTMAAELQPDLILMDIQLPVIDGYEATRRIRVISDLKLTPIIAVTSYALSGDEAKARAAGCDGYVTKPFSPRALLAKVREYLPGEKS